MGNETSKKEYERRDDVNKAVNLALQKQQEIYERKVEILRAKQLEQDKKKDILIHKAIEALEHKKLVYEMKIKSEELQVNQSPHQDLYKLSENPKKVPGKKVIHENPQGTSSIYPTLPSLNTYNFQTNISSIPSGTCNENLSIKPLMVTANHFPNTPTAPRPENVSNKLREASNLDNRNTINCTSCSKKLGLYIFQCRNKHNSCKNCREKNIPCGICNQYITSYRNYGLEKSIAKITLKDNNLEYVKCPNVLDGCCLRFKQNEIKKHLEECPFNEMQCPTNGSYGSCTWRGKINQLKIHFQEKHPENCVCDVDKEMRLNIKNNSLLMYYVTLGSYNFVIYINVDVSRSNIMTTAQLIGTKISASKWSYQFHMFKKNTPKRKYQYNDICRSHSAARYDIFSTDCNVVDLTYAKTFADNDILMYKLYLTKYVNV